MGTKSYVIFAMGAIIFKAPVLVKSLPLLYYCNVDFGFCRGLHIKGAQCCTSEWSELLSYVALWLVKATVEELMHVTGNRPASEAGFLVLTFIRDSPFFTLSLC